MGYEVVERQKILKTIQDEEVRIQMEEILDIGDGNERSLWKYESNPSQTGYWNKRSFGKSGDKNLIIFKSSRSAIARIIKRYRHSYITIRNKKQKKKIANDGESWIQLWLGTKPVKFEQTSSTADWAPKISDSTMTHMQELGSAWVFYQAISKKKSWNDWLAMKADDDVMGELRRIWKDIGKANIDDYDDWIANFHKQQIALINKLKSGPDCCLFDEYNRDEKYILTGMSGHSFMKFITDVARDLGVSQKDNWNPADIWIIRNRKKWMDEIEDKLYKGGTATGTIQELNAIMRALFQKREVFGISLKKVAAGKPATVVYMNHTTDFFTSDWDGSGKGGTDNLVMKFDSATCKMGTKNDKAGKLTLSSQDTRFVVKDGGNTYDFQIKGNDSTKFSGLKYEPTSKGASAARLGKATIELVEQLLKDYDVDHLFDKSKDRYPMTCEEFHDANKFANQGTTWKDMIQALKDNGVNIEVSVDQAYNNMLAVFRSKPWVANAKCQQIKFLNAWFKVPDSDKNKFATDMCWLAMKAGRRYGPFAKVY